MLAIAVLTEAYNFAAIKHSNQRRKGLKDIPYINHPIAVTNLLCLTLDILDMSLLIAAVLHDTIEDTDTSVEEIEQQFGSEVKDLVLEVTDDMSKSKQIRRDAQVEEAPTLSDKAKQIKIADKTCNIIDMLTTRMEWTNKMKKEYVLWSIQVVNGCRGINEKLENEFKKAVSLSKEVLGEF